MAGNSPFRRRFVTLPGLAVFVIAVVMLFRSLSGRNAYEIILSSSVLALWLVLCFAGAWARRHFPRTEPQWKPPFPPGALSAEKWPVGCPAFRVPWFFRLHFIVRGRFFPEGSPEGCAVFAETSFARGSDTAALDLRFPMGGLFRGEGSCRLRDVFGFFSFHCGTDAKQTLKVRSVPCAVKPLRIDARSGAEGRRTRSSSDEERYYMREYAPGDRFRDINWKTSERIDTLITRISPDNQEKVTRVEVFFRNYGPDYSRPGIGELWLLDRAKARLAWFLRSVKEEKSSFIFDVRAAGGKWELKNEEEIEAFLEELAAIPFAPAQSGDVSTETEGSGELYVFSTACDAGLPAFLLAARSRPLSLFLAQNVRDKKAQDEKSPPPEDCACLYLKNFPAGGFVPFPRWFFSRRRRFLNVRTGRMMIDYAETRL